MEIFKLGRGTQFHENFRREQKVSTSTDRAFGIVFAVISGIISCWLMFSGSEAHWWALGIALTFLICSLFRPSLLAPLNKLWARFGLLLHRIVNPVVMGLIFYLAVLPTGLVMRLLGKDLLNLKWDPEAESYWVKREPPGPSSDSIKYQF